MMRPNEQWSEDDATWNLLGKAAPAKPAQHFVADTVRAVKLLPEARPWWSRVVAFSPWAAAAACGVLAVIFILDAPKSLSSDNSIATISYSEEKWSEIEEVADTEMLAAAADDLDLFSDQELVTLIGF